MEHFMQPGRPKTEGVDASCRLAEKLVSEALRVVPGLTVRAECLDSAGCPIEAWEARQMLVTIVAGLAPEMMTRIADDFRVAGIKDVTLLAGDGRQVTAAQLGRIVAVVTDDCISALASIIFSFTDQELAEAGKRKRVAKANADAAMRGASPEEVVREPGRCSECDQIITRGNGSRALTCSTDCAKRRNARLAKLKKAARAAEPTQIAERSCGCGRVFTPTHANQVHCSDAECKRAPARRLGTTVGGLNRKRSQRPIRALPY